MKKTWETDLMIPLYLLYYIDSLDKFIGLRDFQRQALKRDHSIDELKKTAQALELALENPEYNYQSILPNIKFSNKEILEYFKVMHKEVVQIINK